MPKGSSRDRAVDRKVGAKIRLLRIERGISQESLGDALGLTFQQVQKYEKGTNSVAAARMPLLCKVLKIAPNDLFDGHPFASEAIQIGAVAMDIGVRAHRLGLRDRKLILAVLAWIEKSPKRGKTG